MAKVWMRHPDAGGVNVPSAIRARVAERIRRYAEKNYSGKFARLDVRFRGPFCYIDAYTEPDEPSEGMRKATGETREQFLERMRAVPLHLCRLRYFGHEEEWSLGFYSYSNERYKLSCFGSGNFFGSPEEGFEIGALHLRGV